MAQVELLVTRGSGSYVLTSGILLENTLPHVIFVHSEYR